MLVAANDRGYIPAMISAGASPDEVIRIRSMDRAAQGVSLEDERNAENDIRERAQWRGSKVLVRCLHPPTSAHSDRLFGLADEILLAGMSEWSYFGPRHGTLAHMGFTEHHWSGGSLANGYFGISNPSEDSQDRLLRFFWT
jgi:hypothetical protein